MKRALAWSLSVVILSACGSGAPATTGDDAGADASAKIDAGATDVSVTNDEPAAPDVVDAASATDVVDAGMDVVSIDIPDVATPDIPDVATPDIPDVVTPDIPDVVTPDIPDVVTPDIPDVVTPDIPDVVTPDIVDVPPPRRRATSVELTAGGASMQSASYRLSAEVRFGAPAGGSTAAADRALTVGTVTRR